MHSKNVFMALDLLSKKIPLYWSRKESVFLVAFLHDLCKADLYELNPLTGTYSANKIKLNEGHGERSIKMAEALGIDLTDEEKACIRFHMGAFVDKEEWAGYTGAVEEFPNVLWTHTADMEAAHIFEK